MIAIGTFLELDDYKLQNFFHGQRVTWDGKNYEFGGFGYSGSTIDLQGGNIDAQLVMVVNDISLAIAKKASDNRQIAVIKTVWLDPETLVPRANFMQDTFMVTGFEHDALRLGIRLSSPLDAITGEVPRRRLTEKLVGALPSTGQIQLL